MSRELTNQQPAPLPEVKLPDDARASDIIRNRVIFRETTGKFQIDRELTSPERAHLQARKQAIARHLRPLGTASEEKRRLALALGSLFLGYPSLRTDNAATERISAYVDALSAFPIYAALKAIEAVKRGAVADLDAEFPPTSVRLVGIAAQYVGEVRHERHEVEATLDANVGDAPLSEDERKRTQVKMQQFSDEMRAKVEKETGLRGEEMERKMSELNQRNIEREWLSYGMEPMRTQGGAPVSVALARSLDPDLDIRLTNLERKRK